MRGAGAAYAAFLPAVGLILGSAIIANAAAPVTSGTAVPQDEALALVREMSGPKLEGSFLGPFRVGMINTLAARSPLSVDQATHAIDQYFMPVYFAHVGELETRLAAVWSSYFTPSEIQHLRDYAKMPAEQRSEALGNTELGRRFLGEEGQINRQLGAAAKEWGRPVTCLAFRQAGPDLVKLGVDAKLLEAPAEVCPP